MPAAPRVFVSNAPQRRSLDGLAAGPEIGHSFRLAIDVGYWVVSWRSATLDCR